jgi:hypothetical protein
MSPTAQLLLGAVGMASLVAGTLFARFWRRTGDRFFLFFAASFWLEGINRFLIGLFRVASEDAPAFYLIRFAAYALILIGIADKNRLGSKPPP